MAKVKQRERALRRARIKTRAVEGDGEGAFTAYVSIFNVEYDIGWGWREMIQPGAFTASLADQAGKLPVMWDHAWDLGPIGASDCSEDTKGLKADGTLYLDTTPPDPLVQRVWRGMVDETINEWSIAFYPEEITWTKEDPDLDIIVVADVCEVTACLRGANPETETTDLRGRSRSYWIAGDRSAVKGELASLRSQRRRELGIKPPARKRADDVVDDADDDAVKLAQAVDAALDEIADALDDDDTATAKDLLTAAETTVDELIDKLGGVDADDPPDPKEDAAPTADVLYDAVSDPARRALLRERVHASSAPVPSAT